MSGGYGKNGMGFSFSGVNHKPTFCKKQFDARK
jgi:hypothetical protein